MTFPDEPIIRTSPAPQHLAAPSHAAETTFWMPVSLADAPQVTRAAAGSVQSLWIQEIRPDGALLTFATTLASRSGHVWIDFTGENGGTTVHAEAGSVLGIGISPIEALRSLFQAIVAQIDLQRKRADELTTGKATE